MKNGTVGTEIIEMLRTAFNYDCLSKTVVYQWIKHFQDVQKSVKDDDHSGQSPTSSTDEMVAKMKENSQSHQRLTIHEIADKLNISFALCHVILAEKLCMCQVSANFFPRLLMDDQKFHHQQVCEDLKRRLEIDPNFINIIITGD
ncbi:protein GVQW3-like [Tachypleus tridentatus]|uniref:protein GVQW3-like n=1 Tax=Tachypleus tridentatus TaxID=6853 RepID=UPI003FD644D7